jgi:hypothetical protein
MAKSRRNIRKKKYMKGGELTGEQEEALRKLNFSIGQIARLNELNITYEQIQTKIDEFNGPQDELADFVDNYFLNIEINENPNAQPMQIVGANENEDDDLLNISDISIDSRNSGYTTKESGLSGGKKRYRKTMRKNKKHSKKSKNRKHKRKYTYKQKGGVCFGNGIGSNNYDPNFSIYNTRELQLFPYKVTN